MPFLSFFIVAATISLPISFAAIPFGFAPKLFWRCPCCGHPFPYYVPTRGDNLKEKECLLTIKGQHIKYAKLKFCLLIIPSICPECKCKFFEMTGDEAPSMWPWKMLIAVRLFQNTTSPPVASEPKAQTRRGYGGQFCLGLFGRWDKMSRGGIWFCFSDNENRLNFKQF